MGSKWKIWKDMEAKGRVVLKYYSEQSFGGTVEPRKSQLGVHIRTRDLQNKRNVKNSTAPFLNQKGDHDLTLCKEHETGGLTLTLAVESYN
jgi:hypothetical protein